MRLHSINKKNGFKNYAVFWACAGLLLLGGCSDTADQTETGGLNAADAKSVDAAAAKLDEENQQPSKPGNVVR